MEEDIEFKVVIFFYVFEINPSLEWNPTMVLRNGVGSQMAHFQPSKRASLEENGLQSSSSSRIARRDNFLRRVLWKKLGLEKGPAQWSWWRCKVRFRPISAIFFKMTISETIIAQNARILSAHVVHEGVQWAAIIQNIRQKWKELQYLHRLATLPILQSKKCHHLFLKNMFLARKAEREVFSAKYLCFLKTTTKKIHRERENFLSFTAIYRILSYSNKIL